MYSCVTVLIADDHELYREGLKGLLKKEKNIQLLGEAATGKKLISLAEKLKPDVVITDIYMPEINGHEATIYLASHQPAINIIALSMSNEDYSIIDMIEAGAKGFLIKNSAPKEIPQAIRAVHNNEYYFCKLTKPRALKLIGNADPESGRLKLKVPHFNDKEKMILKLICMQLTSREIAEKMNLGTRTIENYREILFEKTGTKNLAGLVMFAVKHHMDY